MLLLFWLDSVRLHNGVRGEGWGGGGGITPLPQGRLLLFQHTAPGGKGDRRAAFSCHDLPWACWWAPNEVYAEVLLCQALSGVLAPTLVHTWPSVLSRHFGFILLVLASLASNSSAPSQQGLASVSPWMIFLCWFFFSFLKNGGKINYCEFYNSVTLNTLPVLFNRDLCLVPEILINPKGDPHPLWVTLHAPCPRFLANNDLLSVSGDWPFLSISYKWSPKLSESLPLDGSLGFGLVWLSCYPSFLAGLRQITILPIICCFALVLKVLSASGYIGSRGWRRNRPNVLVLLTPQPLPMLPVCYGHLKQFLNQILRVFWCFVVVAKELLIIGRISLHLCKIMTLIVSYP